MDRQDYALLTLFYAEQPLKPVQLQKILFLYGEDVKATGFYNFKAWDYGPFSSEIYQDLENAQAQGLVNVEDGRVRTYSLTPDGVEAAQEKSASLGEKQRKHLEALAKWARSLSFSALVREVYRLYPEYRERSVFQG